MGEAGDMEYIDFMNCQRKLEQVAATLQTRITVLENWRNAY